VRACRALGFLEREAAREGHGGGGRAGEEGMGGGGGYGGGRRGGEGGSGRGPVYRREGRTWGSDGWCCLTSEVARIVTRCGDDAGRMGPRRRRRRSAWRWKDRADEHVKVEVII
jgi:hypothetical protein